MAGFRMGAGPQKDQAMIRSLELSAPPHLPEREEGLEMEFIINSAFIRLKFREFDGDIHVPGGSCTQLHQDRSACAQTSQTWPFSAICIDTILYYIMHW